VDDLTAVVIKLPGSLVAEETIQQFDAARD
jgi:hypothetical protein